MALPIALVHISFFSILKGLSYESNVYFARVQFPFKLYSKVVPINKILDIAEVQLSGTFMFFKNQGKEKLFEQARNLGQKMAKVQM